MTRINALLADHRTLSVELWPPRTPEAARRLGVSLGRLGALSLDFASITYGAAGSTRDRTHDLVVAIHAAGQMAAMAHLTCAAHRREELVAILERYRDAGIENVLALGGDPPVGSEEPLAAGDLRYAIELVELAKEVGGFCVAVAAHPAGHPGARDRQSDLGHLADKLNRADLAITQLFFEASEYERLVDDLARRGVDKPVVPGIMPITSARTLQTMERLTGSAVPQSISANVEAIAGDTEKVRAFGVEHATLLAQRVLDAGAPGLHFYTMNDTDATLEICDALGIGSSGQPPGI